MLLIGLMLCCCFEVRAQGHAVADKASGSTGLTAVFESELAQNEQDMALRLEELEGLQKQHDDLQQALAAARSAQAEAESSGDERRQKASLEDVQVRLDDLAALVQKIRTVQMLYDQTVAGYMLASERQRLYRVPEEDGSAGPRGPILGDSTQMLQLAGKEIALLEKNKSILKARAKVLSEEVMSADDRPQKGNLSDQARRSLEQRRRQRLDELQAIESQMSETRKNLARVKARQRILTEEARQESAGLSRWRANIVWSVVFLAVAVALLLLVRLVVTNRVKDAQRRYYLNRSLSILAVFVILIGLLVIFVRDFRYLATGMGVAVAGLAVALQEMITSFFCWFLIRGSQGYRVRDWIRIGDQYGEVVDISLMLTTLGQVTPIDPRGEAGGGWTGGLTILPNSSILKSPIVNFTRGYPFIWCSLAYTFTYESDWKRAETLILTAVEDDEITNTTHQAQKMIDNMTKDFAIRIRNTAPVVRTRAGASGIELTLRFLAHPRRRRRFMDKVNRRIMEAVARADNIDFAYNTLRVIPTSLVNDPEID
jgi:small-conductance mechanosensitive channel